MVEKASEGGLVSTEISSVRRVGEARGEHQAAGTAELELVQSGRGVMDTTSSMLLVLNWVLELEGGHPFQSGLT